MAKPSTTKESEPTFEDAITRLEEIVEGMENSELPLEQLIARYEEGVKLVKTCEEKLKAVEGRIEIISRQARGEPKLEPFDPAKSTEPPPNDKTKVQAREDISLF
jgi:exodeoxyribonuclease VII small subunit